MVEIKKVRKFSHHKLGNDWWPGICFYFCIPWHKNRHIYLPCTNDLLRNRDYRHIFPLYYILRARCRWNRFYSYKWQGDWMLSNIRSMHILCSRKDFYIGDFCMSNVRHIDNPTHIWTLRYDLLKRRIFLEQFFIFLLTCSTSVNYYEQSWCRSGYAIHSLKAAEIKVWKV